MFANFEVLKKFKSVSVLGLSVALLACSPSLSPTQAEKVVKESTFLQQGSTFDILLHKNTLLGPDDLLSEHRELSPLLSSGYLEVVPNTVLFGKGIGARFVLTPKGAREAATGWKRITTGGSEESWQVILARRELNQVVVLKSEGDTAECLLTWRWLPTDVGKALGVAQENHTATARLHNIKGEWQLKDVW